MADAFRADPSAASTFINVNTLAAMADAFRADPPPPGARNIMDKTARMEAELVTWNAQYEQGIAEGLTEEAAITAADDLIENLDIADLNKHVRRP